MPKKFSINEQRQWLELYESGQSEASIARQAHCDVRTLKKGIDQARLGRDVRAAKAGLLKEALHKHQDSLLMVVADMLSAIEVLPLSQNISWKWQGVATSIPLKDAKAECQKWGQPMVTVIFNVEDRVHWELFQEHLKRDKMWEVIDHWKKATAAHLEAKMNLARKTAALLEGKTGYKLVDKPVAPPFIYSYNAVDLLSQAALYHTLGIPDSANLKQNIVANTNYGEVKHRASTLAKAPGAEDECKRNILEAFRELEVCSEARSAATTYREAEKLTAMARRTVEEISLLGLVPGQCRVCRRLGM